MAAQPPGGEPDYKVYRSRRGLLDRFRGQETMGRLRERARRGKRGSGEMPGPPGPGRRRRISPGRVLRWVLLAALAWVLLSAVIFFISAQINQGEGISPDAEETLSGGSSLLTGSTILVLGSDARPKGTKEPGAGGPSRSDTMLLLRASAGQVRRVSILRDSAAPIPGRGTQKINAAFAFGGTALAVQTVERFMGNGLEINHVLQVSFDDFPKFIDSMGGVDIELKRCIRSPPFSGRRVRLRRGKHHLSGRRALDFARVRKNACAPNEGDERRAARQQQLMSAIRRRLFSPTGLVRMPLIAWAAPRTVDTDMAGPGLSGLAFDILTGGAGETRILRPTGVNPDGSLAVSEEERRRGVRHLNGQDR